MAESDIAILLRNDGSGTYTPALYFNPSTSPVAATHMPLDFVQNTSQTGNALDITAATNATPIVLTVASGHGIVANDCVNISGALGNTAANGCFVVTSVTSTTITLQGSAGNGAYTNTSGSYAKIQKLAGTKNLFDALESCVKAVEAYKAAGN